MFKLKKEIPNFSFVEYWNELLLWQFSLKRFRLASHTKKISSEDSNIKTTLYSIIKSTTGKLTVQQLSFELSHRRINFVSRLSKTTLHTSIIDLWSMRVAIFLKMLNWANCRFLQYVTDTYTIQLKTNYVKLYWITYWKLNVLSSLDVIASSRPI